MPIVLTSIPETPPCPDPPRRLLEAFGRQFVDVEAPIDVNPSDNPSNEPQPDLIVLKRECATFVCNPQPQDRHLLMFVHRNPASSGYVWVTVFSEHEAVSPMAAPDAVFRPSQAFYAAHG